MRKKLAMKIALLCSVCLLCSMFSGYGLVDLDATDTTGGYERIPVCVDGTPEFTGYMVDDTVYVPLRSFCGGMNLGAVVRWDGASGTMSVTMGQGGTVHSLLAQVGDFYLYVNDRVVYLGAEIRMMGGNVLVPLSGLCQAFRIGISQREDGLNLSAAQLQVCQPGSAVYDPEDLKWLSHIINAEAGNQSMEGQICVGNVVLNRVADPRFPDTVRDVIFSPNQFCPVRSGTIYCNPDEDAIAAAKLCLEGVNLAGESLYFVNPTTGSTRWFRENLTYAMSMGDHDFYY